MPFNASLSDATMQKNPSAFGVDNQSYTEIQNLRNNMVDLKNKTINDDRENIQKQQILLMKELNTL